MLQLLQTMQQLWVLMVTLQAVTQLLSVQQVQATTMLLRLVKEQIPLVLVVLLWVQKLQQLATVQQPLVKKQMQQDLHL